MKSTTTKLSCYLCGSLNCSLIHDKIRYNLAPRPYRCNECGFTFLYPQMTPDEEREFYDKKYRFYYENQPAEVLWRESIPEAKKRVLRFKNLYSHQTCLLEIGCASGFFLYEVRDYVKTTSGVELTNEYVKYAVSKGLDVKKTLDEIPDDSYDLIFMFHVLEHIGDPIQFLIDIRKKLTDQGKLIIEVPNVDDILVSTYKIPAHLDFYWEIAHNYYFSKGSLGKVLDMAGYKYEIFPLQRYDLSNHMRWMQTGKPGGNGFYNSIFSQSLNDQYEKCLKEQFLCDTIYAISEKNKGVYN
jgi:SAM-dependent methyltransferase